MPHLETFVAAEREMIKNETPEIKVIDYKTQLPGAASKFHFTWRMERHLRRLVVPSRAPMQAWGLQDP